MKINIKDIPSERTRKEIEKEYWYYCQLDWEWYWINKNIAVKMSHRLNNWRTIWRALNTRMYKHWWARWWTEYNWEWVKVNRNTVYGRMRMWWTREQAISIPVWHKKT